MLLIFGSIFRSRIINVGISCVAAFVIGFALTLDLRILGEVYYEEYSLDDHVIAALLSYSYIARRFMCFSLYKRSDHRGDGSSRGHRHSPRSCDGGD